MLCLFFPKTSTFLYCSQQQRCVCRALTLTICLTSNSISMFTHKPLPCCKNPTARQSSARFLIVFVPSCFCNTHTHCSKLPHPCCVFTSVISVHASVVSLRCGGAMSFTHTHSRSLCRDDWRKTVKNNISEFIFIYLGLIYVFF